MNINWIWIYAMGGFFSIMLYLVATGHARLGPIEPGDGVAGCPDKRVLKQVLVFGGASAFTFGGPYFIIARLLGDGLVKEVLLVFGTWQLMLSAFQVFSYLLQVYTQTGNITLKSHLQGCGYTTAWSPFWPLFYLQKVPGFAWVVVLRDILTLVDYVASLPGTIVLSVVTRLFFGKWTIPTISSVDLGDHD